MAKRTTQRGFPFYEDDKRSLVYVATNTVNGKQYVGMTRVGLAKRRQMHKNNAGKGMQSKFCSAIRKHGFDAFEFTILERCATYKIAMAAEQRWIAHLNPKYNMTAGGEGPFGYRHSAEAKAKMSAAKKGKAPWAKGHCPPEVREKLAASGRRRRGEKCRPEVAAARREYILRGALANRRAVICLSDGMTYPSVSAVADRYGMTTGQVSWYLSRGKPVKSRRVDLRGLMLVYAEGVDSNDDDGDIRVQSGSGEIGARVICQGGTKGDANPHGTP